MRLTLIPTFAFLCAGSVAAQTTGLSRQLLKERLPADAVIAPLDVHPRWINRTGPGVYWKQTSPVDVRAPYYALHFSGLQDNSGAAWRFHVDDPAGHELMSFGASDKPAGDFWTDDLHADQLTFVIESDRKPVGLTFTIDRWLVADPKPALRSILVPGDPKIELIETYRGNESVWVPGLAVAKLAIKDSTRRYSCTGFLIAKDELLTNEHCIPTSIAVRTPGACKDSIDALFDYVVDGVKPSRCSCAEVLAKNVGLDYAVLRLSGVPGERWGVLQLESSRAPRGGTTGEPLRVIEHPGGRVKAVAIKRCRADHVGVPGVTGGADAEPGHAATPVAADNNQDFDHICDTEGGSSGSPVLDESGRVVGLHHFGFTDDAVVRRNQAVLMNRIVASFPDDIKSALAR